MGVKKSAVKTMARSSRDPVDGGVVGRVEPHEEVGSVGRVEALDHPEDGAQLGGGELAGAAGPVGEAGEPDRFVGRAVGSIIVWGS